MEIQKELEQLFKWFHQHPELSYQEFETTERIRELLEKYGIDIINLPLETGLVASIQGSKGAGPTIALRADIDALPVHEETELEWKSEREGVMHACGHDFHTTTLIGVAILLHQNRSTFSGTVKLVFQPAEESSIGALKIIETGVLDDVEVIHGIHVTGEFPMGTVSVREGEMTGAVDRFKIHLKGIGSHAAKPELSKDPIVAVGALIQSLQTIVSRNSDPFQSSLLSLTHVQAGSTWNVIPERATVEGTIRTLKASERKLFKQRFYDIVSHIAMAYNVDYSIDWIKGPPATRNHPKWVEVISEIAKQAGLNVEVPKQNLGGEDFAFYQEKIPGVYWQIGTGITYPNHHPKFQVSPEPLSKASEIYTQLALQTLKILRGEKDD